MYYSRNFPCTNFVVSFGELLQDNMVQCRQWPANEVPNHLHGTGYPFLKDVHSFSHELPRVFPFNDEKIPRQPMSDQWRKN